MISYFQSVRERPSENKKEHIMEIVVKQNEDGKWEGKLLVDGRIRCLAFGKDSEEEVHESLNLDWIQFAR
jgi:hypothetical protein|tara:strand:+ start:225 stop:434 length:210 start_codon:yes stop_codon:yes gene_type:complete